MSEWNTDLSAKLPAEGEPVEIRIPGGKTIKPVEFSRGRFWKVRKEIGGQAYTVEAWRAIEKRAEAPKRTEKRDLRKETSADGTA